MRKKRAAKQKSAEITPEMHEQYRKYIENLNKFTVQWNTLVLGKPQLCVTCPVFKTCDYFQNRNERKPFCGKELIKEEQT